MKAVQRMFSAWRRFFFVSGRIIPTFADSGWRLAARRAHPAAPV
jgi:hypothetical protein